MQKVEFTGDSPKARFGHTITPIFNDKAILFGGAVGQVGKYLITSDTYICHLHQHRWQQVTNTGTPPTNRAAHATVAVDHFVYVFGGALGGGDLADDNLYELDFLTVNDKAHWSIKNCSKTSPGARYGHVMAYIKPYLVVYGGNTGSEAVGDVWRIDLTGQCRWQKVMISGQSPLGRVYHSGGLCKTGAANGMLVIFGGRSNSGQALNDTWGLRKHRDNRFDWMKAPYRSVTVPSSRYQHRCLFVGTLLLVIGGRNNQSLQSMPFDVYDTDTSQWHRVGNIDRFRHVCFALEKNIFVYGGFDLMAPNISTDSIIKIDLQRAFTNQQSLFKGLAEELGKDFFTKPAETNPNLRGSKTHQESRRMQEAHRQSLSQKRINSSQRMQAQQPLMRIGTAYQIKLSSQAVVANFNDDQQIKKMRIDDLPSEHRRLVGNSTVGFARQHIQKLSNYFINALLGRPVVNITLQTPSTQVDQLLAAVQRVFDSERALVNVRYPVKIIGDIHGQLSDLNRLFAAFEGPEEAPNGDIQYTNYVFLGDYVDRGLQSLQTILLLFALKIKYPDSMILLRGSHQDRRINRSMGFGDECAFKLKEDIDSQYSFFNRVNKLFEKMPLAALLENSVLCIHGGLGSNLSRLSDFGAIPKPLVIVHDGQSTNSQTLAYHLLWNDPCREMERDGQPNFEHDYFLTKKSVKFSQERVNDFCIRNDLVAIVRSHEPVQEGYDQIGSMLTVFSCSNYGGRGNKCSLLHIMKNGEIVPKVLNPTGNEKWLPLNQASLVRLGQADIAVRRRGFTPPKN